MADDYFALPLLLVRSDIYSPSAVDGMGGWALLSTLLQTHRTPNSLTLVCGDFLGGSALGEYYRGRNVTQLMQHIGTDVVVIGNQSGRGGTRDSSWLV